MKLYLASLVLASTLVSWEPVTEPSWCNALQNKIVERVENLRKYEPGKLNKACVNWLMKFYEDGNAFGFAIKENGMTYYCDMKGEDLMCHDPKNEEDMMEAMEILYSSNKVNI